MQRIADPDTVEPFVFCWEPKLGNSESENMRMGALAALTCLMLVPGVLSGRRGAITPEAVAWLAAFITEPGMCSACTADDLQRH